MKQHKTLDAMKEGFVSSLPVMVGYFPVAMAFGLLGKTVGVPFLETALFSIMVFAGASQFMALDLIRAGAMFSSIILATFLLNLRHIMMSASLSVRLESIKKNWFYWIAFGVTDETFSVSSLKKGELKVPFLLTLHSASYLAWVGGTIAGYLVGSILPEILSSSLGIGLYAMFAALLIPEVKKSKPVLKVSLLSAAVYTVIHFTRIIPSDWSLIATIVIASFLGMLIVKELPKAEKEGAA